MHLFPRANLMSSARRSSTRPLRAPHRPISVYGTAINAVTKYYESAEYLPISELGHMVPIDVAMLNCLHYTMPRLCRLYVMESIA
jgi:hypothetical protein